MSQDKGLPETGGGIAVVGLGCWYPGARGPREFWENVLARRRQFRRMPDCRLSLAEYHDPDPSAPDKTYGRRAAVIDGFQFDWVGNRIPKKTFEGTDVVQWLALEVARQAIEHAGYSRESVPRDRTGVILGNTLTGEHTRSNTMRLRWPFVRRALLAAAERKGMPPRARDELAAAMEVYYKSVFPPITEDTLAGGLSNTIAGRICNNFDFHGGGYTVDGACSSSLLAVCTAADKLAAGQLDLALAGGVDISLDTFELVGFAKTGALTPDDMRVYDRRANGFIPGEGCGFVALKRLDDARACGDTVYAVLRGWGVSSDGKGGITAPSREGQAAAIRRAYERAGYGPGQLDFVEGHGTGTKVGDREELAGLALAFEAFGATGKRTCGMTSLKSILGHTKAAAGIGAFLKATIAVNRRVVPPSAGCSRPNDVFETTAGSLYVVLQGAAVEPSRTLRAGVSAMGFGGINCHVTLESGDPPANGLAPAIEERALMASSQETEVFILGSASAAALVDRLPNLAAEVELLSQAELTDLAARLALDLPKRSTIRAALLAGTLEELAARLREMEAALGGESLSAGKVVADPRGCWWVGWSEHSPRIGFLLPGQGSQQLQMGRTLVERHEWARQLVSEADRYVVESGGEPVSSRIYRHVDRATGPDEVDAWKGALADTEVAQPAICLTSLLYVRHLASLGLSPAVVVGHSLGELTALHVAGAFDGATLLKLAVLRGRLLAAPSGRSGAMASLACPRGEAEDLLRGVSGLVVVANLNGPNQTVISGDETAVADVVTRAGDRGIVAKRIPVSNAFHSPLVAEAAARLRAEAAVPETLPPLAAMLLSGIDGQPVAPGRNLREYLAAQVLTRVDFVALVGRMAVECDLLIEVGPGRVLTGLVGSIAGPDGPPCLPIASNPDADHDLLTALARAFVLGAEIRWERLYDGRFVRPYVPASERLFLDNPCERPFPEVAVAATDLGYHAGSSMEAELAEATGTSPEQMRAYLTRRQNFLVNVVRADLDSLDAAPAAPLIPSKPAERPCPTPDAAPASDDLEGMLLNLAAEQTGFPRESLTLEIRLLDDLNLDSIKAAELVAKGAKMVGVAGRVDPSALANASLAEVAAALRRAVSDSTGQARGTVPVVVDATSSEAIPLHRTDPSWVRTFVFEYVPEAA